MKFEEALIELKKGKNIKIDNDDTFIELRCKDSSVLEQRQMSDADEWFIVYTIDTYLLFSRDWEIVE